MKLLVLGGTKFLGRALVEAALAAGHEVTTFNRGQTNAELFPKLERLHGDRDGGLEALRGRTWNALLGVLVIVSIQYGLQLESIQEPVKYMITAGVLLTTVVIDSVTRKTQKTAGRA